MNDSGPEKVNVKKSREGRKRRAAGWTLLTLGVIVAAAWFASRWWEVRKRFDGLSFGVYEGQVSVGVGDIPAGDLVVERTYLTHWDLWMYWGDFDQGVGVVKARGLVGLTDLRSSRHFTLVLWPIPLLLFAAGVPILRSGIRARRRATSSACPKCGYSLAGLGDGARCPECGTKMANRK